MTRTTVLGALAGVAAALALVAGCGEEPPPPPTPTPVASPTPVTGPVETRRVPAGQELLSFQLALAQRDLVVGTSDEETRLYAQTVCGQLDAGAPPIKLITDVQAGTGYSLNDTGYIIGAAVSSFCPQNLQRLPRG